MPRRQEPQGQHNVCNRFTLAAIATVTSHRAQCDQCGCDVVTGLFQVTPSHDCPTSSCVNQQTYHASRHCKQRYRGHSDDMTCPTLRPYTFLTVNVELLRLMRRSTVRRLPYTSGCSASSPVFQIVTATSADGEPCTHQHAQLAHIVRMSSKWYIQEEQQQAHRQRVTLQSDRSSACTDAVITLHET